MTRKGTGAEVVEMNSARFKVEKRNGRWVVVALTEE
jgi:hypothetical protein